MSPLSSLWVSFALLSAMAVVACKQGSSSDQGEGAESAAELTDEALDKTPIPVKEDFEEEATASINEDNVETEVDSLEKEIQADTP